MRQGFLPLLSPRCLAAFFPLSDDGVWGAGVSCERRLAHVAACVRACADGSRNSDGLVD